MDFTKKNLKFISKLKKNKYYLKNCHLMAPAMCHVSCVIFFLKGELLFSSVEQVEVEVIVTNLRLGPKLQTVVHVHMNNWDKGVAPAICPCILSAGEY